MYVYDSSLIYPAVALDFQNCGIGNEGAEALLNICKMTGQLEVIDLRLNDIGML